MSVRTPTARHPRLGDQLGRLLGPDAAARLSECQPLLDAISEVYDSADREREELEQLRSTVASLTATLEATGDGIVVVDTQGQVTGLNDRLQDIFGLAPSPFMGQPARNLMRVAVRRFSDPLSIRRFARDVIRTPHAERSSLLEMTDGRVLEVHTRPQRIGSDVLGRVWCYRDVTQRVDVERRLAHQAYHDALTGLPNRARFRQRAEEALLRSGVVPEAITVLLLDLDGFKAVNDTLGHAGGDALLVQAADRLLNATRGCDMVARLGGDEFGVLLANVRTVHDVNTVAERILTAMRAPFYVAGVPVTVGASIGIARSGGLDESAPAPPGSEALVDTLPERMASAYELVVRHADLALYLVKSGGRGQFAHFDPSLHSTFVERRATARALQAALDDQRIQLVYQPIVSLKDRRVVSVEALLRWTDPVRGSVPPTRFVNIAEEEGLVARLGRYVLLQACRQRMQWASRHPEATPFSVTVNISGLQLNDAAFVDTVSEVLQDTGLPPGHLVLEFTERTIIEQPEFSLERLQALRALGVQLALDDFGTGYSALGYLQRFPLDTLKIDKSFVDGLTQGGSFVALTSALIALGTALSLTTVAEGVETSEQEQLLRDMGCTLGQGYLFHKPLSPDELQARLLVGAREPGTSR